MAIIRGGPMHYNYWQGKRVTHIEHDEMCMMVNLRLEDGTMVSIDYDTAGNVIGVDEPGLTVYLEPEEPKEPEFDYDKIKKIMEM